MTIELDAPSKAEHREALRERIRSRSATATDFLAYNLLRGKPALQGFQPRTNPSRLAKGQGPFDGFLRASQASYSYADGLPKQLEELLDPPEKSALRQARVRALCDTFRRAQAQGLSIEQRRGMLRKAMQATPQGLSNVEAHCRQTEAKATRLMRALDHSKGRERDAPPWLAPWFFESKALTLSTDERRLLLAYLRFHDCGKPFVYTEDTTGRVHFPHHAQVSSEIWATVGGSIDEQYLMAHDMLLQTLPATALQAFSQGRFAKLQLIAAVASLWANEKDFGGSDSTSFKVKLKHLERRGRALCRMWAASL